MILSDDEVLKRLNSPTNLMNRLSTFTENKRSKSEDAMSIFIRPKQEAPQPSSPAPKPTDTTQPENAQPTLDSLIQNHEAHIQLGLAHNSAIGLLNKSIGLLGEKLDDVLPSRLPAVISAASKVVESIRKERAEASKSNQGRNVHYHFYTPQQKKMEEYDVIDVS